MISDKTDIVHSHIAPDPVIKNGLEDEINNYKDVSIRKLKFRIIFKPAVISFLALIFSFFLDLAYVPFLGDISTHIGKALFPTWVPAAEVVVPYSFWWLPVIIYSLFVLLSYLAFNKLKAEVMRSPATETVDRIITSYTSVIDSVATALPLIGAALLLISIKMGEEIFLGLSVPLEIKALIILALGKLFEPVLDQLGIDFQNIVNHVKDIREKYFLRIQVENSKNLIRQISGQSYSKIPEFSIQDMQVYRDLLQETSKYSELMVQNFSSMYDVLEKIRTIDSLNPEKLSELNKLAENLSVASKHLGDENTRAGLQSLENIIVRK